jgi:hypothetical protein
MSIGAFIFVKAQASEICVDQRRSRHVSDSITIHRESDKKSMLAERTLK